MSRTPLAWLDLTHHKRRLAMSVTGVAFAVFLIFIEIGFLNGVYDSQTDLVSHFNADLVLVNRLKEDVRPLLPFSRGRLLQAANHGAVSEVYPLYVDSGRWKNLDEHLNHFVLTLGFNPSQPVLDLPDVQANSKLLEAPETALFDEKARPFFGSVKTGTLAELERRRVRVVGTFRLGPDFRTDGMVIMSDTNFLRYFQNPPRDLPDPDRIEFGLIKLHPGHNPATVRAQLSSLLPDEVSVLTKQELMERTRQFWKRSKSVGTVFGMGAAVGFVIGVIICYQILFNDISDHYPQYATLKALGYSELFLVKIVLQKALLLSLFGFVPGMVLSVSLYSLIEQSTGIRMWLTPERALTVLILSAGMCVLAGLLAIFKVARANPADLY